MRGGGLLQLRLESIVLCCLCLMLCCLYIVGILYLLIVKMHTRMRDLACSQGEEKTRTCLTCIEAFVTIAVGSVDIDVRLLVNLKRIALWVCARLRGVVH